MCGRFTHLYKWKELHRLLTLTTPPMEFRERYNVAPTQDAPVVRDMNEGGRGVSMLRWGLVPSWAKDVKIGASLINARAETVAAKPAFRSAFVRRRCIVPVSGFYEWRKHEQHEPEESSADLSGLGLFGPIAGTTKPAGKPAGASMGKQPFYIASADGEPLLLAGLWESWGEPDSPDGPLETFTILTTAPNEMIAKLHDRMPVVLDPAGCGRWLDCASVDASGVADLLKPWPAELMICHPVSRRVNSPRIDDRLCMQAI